MIISSINNVHRSSKNINLLKIFYYLSFNIKYPQGRINNKVFHNNHRMQNKNIRNTNIQSLLIGSRVNYSCSNKIIDETKAKDKNILDKFQSQQLKTGFQCINSLKQSHKMQFQQKQLNQVQKEQNFINYTRIYQQNKKRLQKIQSKVKKQIQQSNLKAVERDYQLVTEQGNQTYNKLENGQQKDQKNQNLKQQIFPFDKEYLKRNILDHKYFYSDLISIANKIINQLICKIDQVDKSKNENRQSNFQDKLNNNKDKSNANKDNSLQSSQQQIVNQTQLHFLLYTFHLYTKQLKPLKQFFIRIIQEYLTFNSFNCSKNKPIQENIEFYIYLRRFLQAFSITDPDLLQITKNYSHFLKASYLKNKQMIYNQGVNHLEKLDFSQQILSKVKLLQSCVLAYPNICTFSKVSQIGKNNIAPNINKVKQNEDSNENKSEQRQIYEKMALKQKNVKQMQQIHQNYNFFIQQFNNYFNTSLQYWLNMSNLNNFPDPLPINFSYRNYLNSQYKRLNLNSCYNRLLMVLNRLWVLIEVPKTNLSGTIWNQTNKSNNSNHSNMNSNTNNTNKNSSLNNLKNNQNKLYNNNLSSQQNNQSQPTQNHINLKQYLDLYKTKLNIVQHFPLIKYKPNNEIKFMALLIVLKKLLVYHTIRNIEHQKIGNYLEKLFQMNYQEMIVSKNIDKSRQIKFLIGQLISRLATGLWYDTDDRLGKFFGETNLQLKREPAQRIKCNRAQWIDFRRE